MPGPTTYDAASIARQARDTQDVRASQLILTLSSLPSDDPRRPALRHHTIEAWLPMSRRLARRYTQRGEPGDDLQQVAALGLIKAVDRFDPRLNPDFVSYAVPSILGELKRHFRDHTWAVRIPRRLQELRLAISRAHVELTQALNASPTVADIAAHLGTSEEHVLEGLETGAAYRAVSLSTPLGDAPGRELTDVLGARDTGYELAEFSAALPLAMTCLTDREKHILTLRFYGNLSQSSIAQRVGVSQMHVSRLLASALHKLRRQMS